MAFQMRLDLGPTSTSAEAKEIEDLYRKYNPAKLPQLPELLQKYKVQSTARRMPPVQTCARRNAARRHVASVLDDYNHARTQSAPLSDAAVRFDV